MSGTGGWSNPSGSHLMICLLINKSKGEALIVPLVTKRANIDCTCEFGKGDHPFIKHASCADFSHIKKCSVDSINQMLEDEEYSINDPISNEQLVGLLKGLLASEETAGWAVTYAKKNGVPDMIKILESKL